jgi:toxin YoeB
MILAWAEPEREDYLYWQLTGRKTLKRINALIQHIQRQPFQGVGDPEPLKHQWPGYWSRRIDHEHRLVYRIKDSSLIIVQCPYHY